ncbi:Hypothetical protein GLP15_3151 [Giardia lamblia P15]|uniref:Uncharacterized protein n=1 Tax=Giardia intestinalis (strain P15) TaxID=658858 RepID=E1F956_GIAIA|nr:Hypothetical protein GLP15_3151 [Giardia lamblia P15]
MAPQMILEWSHEALRPILRGCMKIYKIPMSGADASTGGTRMPSSLEDLLSSHGKDEPSTSRDISTRIGALKARLARATAASGGSTVTDAHLSSPHLPEPFHRRASVGGAEAGHLASEIPRSSLSDAHYSEELYSARYNDHAASSGTLEVEMLKRRVAELENEVIVLRNENEALRNRLTIACTQGLCRSATNQSAMNASHAPAPRQTATSATVSNIRPAALDMSNRKCQQVVANHAFVDLVVHKT